MIQGIVVWLFTLLLSYIIIGVLQQRHPVLDRRFMVLLFFYHTLLTIAYYLYALSNPSDSINYFFKALTKTYGDRLWDYFGTSTQFINFITFFLVDELGFSYEACMAFFSWLGFLGFIYFYMFFKERIKSGPTIFGVDGTVLILLLPNLHFWSSSVGKGSVIFLGFGLFFFALNRPGLRLLSILLGGWIIFQIRPHVFYVILLAVGLGYTFSTKGVSMAFRVGILFIAVFLLFYIYEDILAVTGLEDDSILDSTISHRARELSKATSGIDITNYSLPQKLFAFWFRPLFFDAPGMLGIIVSFENLFYLVFFAQLLRPSGIRFLWSSDALEKTCLFTFIGVSFALAQITGNLGLALRQKSQVMILMLFVVLKFFDKQKLMNAKQLELRKQMQTRTRQKLQSWMNA